MQLALIGAVESSRVALDALIASDHPPSVIITLPLDKASRHSDFVDLRPHAKGIKLIETADVNSSEVITALAQTDLAMVIGWSQLMRPEVVEAPERGCIGFHPSDLPTNRGRAVIPWTIIQGRTTSGSSLFWIDDGMDTGDIFAATTFDVSPDETATTLYAKHMTALQAMLSKADLSADVRVPQDHSAATYCSQRRPIDGAIDWTRPADELWTLIRASTKPYPGAFTTTRNGETLTIWSADLATSATYWGIPGQVQAIDEHGALVQCGGRSLLRLKTIQFGDKPPQSAHSPGVLRVQDRFRA